MRSSLPFSRFSRFSRQGSRPWRRRVFSPPSALERALGDRRARVVRRRAGWAALAIGVMLLRPSRPRWRSGRVALLGLAVASVVIVGAIGPFR